MTQNKVLGIFIFLNFVPKNFFGKIWSQNMQVLCLKWNLIKRVFKDANFELDNCFLKFCP